MNTRGTKATKVMVGGSLAGALLLSACGGGAQDSQGGSASQGPGARAGTLTIAANDTIESLDPATAFVGWPMSRDGVTETLIDVGDTLELVPELAAEWTNTDPTTWKITLRDGVTFHNGAKLDANAAKASLEHSIATNVRAKSQLPIQAITADGNTLTISTSQPLPALPNILTDPMMSIQAIGDGVDPNTKPIATGPYKLEEFVPNQHRTLVANADYWQGAPKLSTLTVKTYADAQAMSLALQSGEADVVVRPDAATLGSFSDTTAFTTWQTTSTRSDGVIVNMTSPVMSDPLIREAIAYSLDRDAYVSLLHGMAKASPGFFPENVYFGGVAGLDVPVATKDLTKTKELFIEAGYTESGGQLVKDGKPATLRLVTYPSRPYLGRIAALLQSDLRGLGIAVEITEVKDNTAVMTAGDFDLGMYSMATAPTGDPEYFLDTMLRSTSESNYSHYTSAAFDAALADLSSTFGSTERTAKAKVAEQILLNDMPYLMFGSQQWWAVSSAKVKGLSVKPTEYHLIDHETHVE